MKIVFRGRGSIQGFPSNEAYLLEEGKMYEASNTVVKKDEKPHYRVTIKEGRDVLCPMEWFFNLTSAIEEHSAQLGVIGAPPFIGDRVTVAKNVIPEKLGCTIQYVLTSPVEDAKEVAPWWYLFKTMTGSHYLVQVNPEFKLELLN